MKLVSGLDRIVLLPCLTRILFFIELVFSGMSSDPTQILGCPSPTQFGWAGLVKFKPVQLAHVSIVFNPLSYQKEKRKIHSIKNLK